jgi:hypothetical protein
MASASNLIFNKEELCLSLLKSEFFSFYRLPPTDRLFQIMFIARGDYEIKYLEALGDFRKGKHEEWIKSPLHEKITVGRKGTDENRRGRSGTPE